MILHTRGGSRSIFSWELYITNWSYSNKVGIFFAIYQIMISKRTSWAGTRLAVGALLCLRQQVSSNFSFFPKPWIYVKSCLLIFDRYQQLPYFLHISFLSKKLRCHISAYNIFLDAIFSLVILCSVMQNINFPGF